VSNKVENGFIMCHLLKMQKFLHWWIQSCTNLYVGI